ncbi:Holliday junction branch migration DNA helicase RuvB [Mesomycoplasma neurolyticum]|uniref:Holliday junction branch migration complex subunit RuvB n=1 Tax=Mesomycoplasma neurolyticum TaxID=2120 RepID=A0A449A6D9_9BACT|nr:Holliday junction branch migration DNA helicase RuvB [Mesomycoplasma neurolyticum]VEU59804.1 Holliday junction ATP-dependent DNA helicase RuvB [Mesomycoplasma neurolyticum]
MQENLEIRPKNFKEFIGQEKIVKTLKVLINSSKKRNKPLDHILLYGPPGLGKTTLAKIISAEINSNIKFIQGSLVEKKSDILTIFSSIKKGDIIFIDEIHSINKNIEELFYTAMEEYVIDVQIGLEGESKIMRMKLPTFTIIGATTKVDKISQPLKDRFGFVGKLNFYNNNEMVQIFKNTLIMLKLKISLEWIHYLITFVNCTPRIAINLLKRIRDFSIYENATLIEKEIIDKTLENIGLYKYGLTNLHLEYLKLLNDVFKNKSVSLNVLSGILKESKENLINNIEPKLLELNLIEKTSKGRKITYQGCEYIIKNNF